MRPLLVPALLCASAVVPPATTLKVIDAMPPFFTFWDAAQGKSDARRIDLFKKIVVGAHPELFTESVIPVTEHGAIEDRGAALDKRIAEYLAQVAPHVPAMRADAAQIDGNLKKYSQDFLAQFPDFAPQSPTYFTISMLTFDGGTRQVNGKTALLFGVDSIASEEGLDISVLFDHELFHQYHDQIAPESDADDGPLWQHLWEEGLATYVSRKMNPQASEADALMFPHDLAERAGPMLRRLARELRDNIDSKSEDEYGAFFSGRSPRPNLPGRSGYYVGYLIAGRIAERDHLGLRALAQLRGEKLRKLLAAELDALATGK